MTSIAITGHRVGKINNPVRVQRFLAEKLSAAQPEAVYCGMANGVDLWAGEIALELGLNVMACVPWAGHKPGKGDEKVYQRIINEAWDIFVLDESFEYAGPWVYQNRNRFMVDHADKVLSVWDGTTGGTNNCVRYALKIGREVLNFDPNTFEKQRIIKAGSKVVRQTVPV